MNKRDQKDLAEARERAERARKYALACPDAIPPNDPKFATVEWQLEQVKRFNRACAPQK